MSTESLAVVVHENAPVHVPVNAAERGHHPYSPSTLQSLEACPAWQGKQSKVPHPRTVIGTLSHACIENGEDNPKLSDGDVEKIADCISFYERRKQLMQESGSVIELKETRLSIDDEDTTGGFIDCALVNHDRTYAEIMDWKLGMWPVTAADQNLQGAAYTLGLFRLYPTLQSVQFFFVQPNIDYITSHTFKRGDIDALYLRVQVVVAKAKEARRRGDFSTARAMVPACTFCKHIGVCPKVTEIAIKVGNKFSPLDIPASVTPSEIHDAKDTRLGLHLAGVLAVWAAAFKNTLTDRVIRMDAPVPEGYTLQSRSNREIVDAKKYQEAALKRLTKDEYEATLTPSFGAVEEKISERAPRGQKSAEIKAFAEEVEASGAVVRGQPYTFLRATPSKDK